MNCDTTQMAAKLEDGLLVLTMPKVEVNNTVSRIQIEYICLLEKNTLLFCRHMLKDPVPDIREIGDILLKTRNF